MAFLWSLRDSKSPQVTRILLSILAGLNNAVVSMASTCPLTSKSSSLFTNPLGIVPSAPITTGITINFMFHSFFFRSLTKSRYFFSLSFHFTLWLAGTAKSKIRPRSLLLIIILFGEFFTPALVDGLSLEFGGARGVVVIAFGNEHGETSSNPGRYWLHFT